MTLVLLLLADLVCGGERWGVKVMHDFDSLAVDPVALPSTIVALNRLPARCDGGFVERQWPYEFRTYRVTGTVLRRSKEKDQDLHIVLADKLGRTIVVEVPDPHCAFDSIAVETLRRVRRQALKIRRGQTVVVEGVGFYDRWHGQFGMADSCLELHPVLKIERVR